MQTYQGSKGEYAVLAEHPRGGTARVFRVRRVADGTIWALKVQDIYQIPTSTSVFFQASTPYCSAERAQAEFANDTRILGLLDHPRIPRLEEAFTTGDGKRVIVMQHVEHTNLAHLLNQRGALSEAQALDYGAQLCTIVADLHSHQISMGDGSAPRTLGDVARGDVLITPDNQVWLCDFGGATTGNVAAGWIDFRAIVALILTMLSDTPSASIEWQVQRADLSDVTRAVLERALRRDYQRMAAFGAALAEARQLILV